MILSNIKYKLGYDDSLDAFGVHGVGGVIGCILTGVFAHAALGGVGLSSGVSIYQQVLVQLLSTVVTLAWSAFWSFIILKLIDCTLGLRISDEEETGLDLTYHGERGYNL
jgi:Amt family ammonium transporter